MKQDPGDIGTAFGFGKYETLGQFVQLLMPIAFSIAALMVVFYFLIAALELITSQGDKAHIVSARSKIYHAIIGFVLLIALFLIMQYVPEALGLQGFRII
jgi:hypothetical protein